MPNLEASFRALSVLHTAKDLFKENGFYIGIDRIIEEAKIPKATFYNYFHSKEKFIELCLTFQKDQLKEKVRGVIETSKYSTLTHKLRQIYLLHADLNSAYYLLFKAIFEIKTIYPNAYQTAIRYRCWLKNEIFCLLMETKKSVSYAEAEIFVFMIDGAILDLLGSDQVMQRDALLEYFLKRV
ncbi:TetR/AcrR family transcriptional regulator [Acinetobacter oleivorans]|uniref:TetR/AcrR family transcriptional regulator n=1 Tax=Acinetobacter oleivorans TaxID=1148157 RepID=UPI001CD65604|nr:TetR/AcrR family transcriptional regulator [Acinetobacter oleivorans]